MNNQYRKRQLDSCFEIIEKENSSIRTHDKLGVPSDDYNVQMRCMSKFT